MWAAFLRDDEGSVKIIECRIIGKGQLKICGTDFIAALDTDMHRKAIQTLLVHSAFVLEMCNNLHPYRLT